ncbi:hypothetical protein BU16DRAFT_469035 [Lophium mytilinum]|uniref:Peptide N-acetyl-beta-D-glucosaminyl asparaginase amidase A N-terminal domain-containing protein n=1 Tax=Lophium mytilinum TaxID=390894 RepID=A0A6A6QFU6_9PEZI|nr:hypothetical protein BU16DRAFT_469035 [Lophium mytilinum]
MGHIRAAKHQQLRAANVFRPLVCTIIMLMTLSFHVLASPSSASEYRGLLPHRMLAGRASNQSSSFLDVFQVSPPVLSPEDAPCEKTLMVHSFAFSYGKPFVGEYSPPSCDFNRVTFNFTVVSAGRQFDRLGLMYFNDTEVFRTSTAEPTATGIEWTYIKDMTNFLVLFKEPQKIIFDLGNLVNEIYTASFNATLTATFFTDNVASAPADVIIPISARQSANNAPSAFSLPGQNATNALTLPRNVKKAVFSISACGQAAEEFWWGNVPSSNLLTFPAMELSGYSPFRETQLYIDGMLAGVAWPFPVIFTGGVDPGFWRPVVGIDAFDLREDEIDVSAFLPVLCDGDEHTFEIRVAGISDDGYGHGSLTNTVGASWVVTGKIFLWLDASDWITTGSNLVRIDPHPALHISSSVSSLPNGTNVTLEYSVQVQRHLSLSSTIKTSEGSRVASWQQTLTFSNQGNYSDGGNLQINTQSTKGVDLSSLGYSRAYDYPLWATTAYAFYPDDAFTIGASIDRSKNVQTLGQLAFPSGLQTFGFEETIHPNLSPFSGTTTVNRQNGTATYTSIPSQSRSYSSGSTEQDLKFAGVEASLSDLQRGLPDVKGSTELYHRHVLAVNSSVVEDEESFSGQTFPIYHSSSTGNQDFAPLSLKYMLGRGPYGT